MLILFQMRVRYTALGSFPYVDNVRCTRIAVQYVVPSPRSVVAWKRRLEQVRAATFTHTRENKSQEPWLFRRSGGRVMSRQKAKGSFDLDPGHGHDDGRPPPAHQLQYRRVMPFLISQIRLAALPFRPIEYPRAYD